MPRCETIQFVLVYIGNYVITYLAGIKSKLFTLVLSSVIVVGLTPFGVRGDFSSFHSVRVQLQYQN